MLVEYELNIKNEIEYAKRWAHKRNPAYYNFDNVGGDCTNYISQCVYAGGAVMNYTRDVGWYYISSSDRAAAWTGVEFFYSFFVSNKGVGPFGIEVPLYEVKVGDVIQLGDSSGHFYHSLIVVNINGGMPYVASHTFDSFDRPLYTYDFVKARCIHIIGARRNY